MCLVWTEHDGTVTYYCKEEHLSSGYPDGDPMGYIETYFQEELSEIAKVTHELLDGSWYTIRSIGKDFAKDSRRRRVIWLEVDTVQISAG